jgi:hypothetical protein
VGGAIHGESSNSVEVMCIAIVSGKDEPIAGAKCSDSILATIKGDAAKVGHKRYAWVESGRSFGLLGRMLFGIIFSLARGLGSSSLCSSGLDRRRGGAIKR